MNSEQLWTVDQAAAFLQVDRTMIYKWMSDGQLPSIRLGARARRLDPAKVRAFAEARTENQLGDHTVDKGSEQ